MSEFESARSWRRAPTVVLRPEAFGALAYDFTSRRLSFLKSPDLVRVVEQLEVSPSADAALETVGIPAADRPRYLRALAALAGTGMITIREAGDAT